MRDFIKKHKYGIIAVIISMASAILFCVSKRDFHVDESLTFALANAPGGWIDYETYGWYTSDNWKNYAVYTPFDYINVFQNQYWDVHPPLYYCLLHTLMSFFPGRFSIWFGLIINIVFFFLDLLIIYTIINKFTKNDLISGFGVLLFGLNKHILDGVILIRMYMMSSFFVLLFLLIAIGIINKEGNKHLNLLFLFLSVIGGGLTHYQFYMIIASISLCIAIYLIIKKRWFDLISSFIAVLSAGLLNVFVIFKGTQYHLTVNSYGTHVGTAVSNLESLFISKERLTYFIANSWGGYLEIILSIILLVLLVYKLIKDKNKELELPLVILISYLIAYSVVLKTSTFLSARYLLPAESIGMIANLLSVYYLLKDKLDIKKLGIIFTLMILLNISFSQVTNNIGTQSSWDFAKQHKDDKVYIITRENITPSDINVLFTNLMEYKETGITQLDKDLAIDDGNDLIIYIDNNLSVDKAIEYVKSEYSGTKEYSLEKVNIELNAFSIYIMTFK